MREQHFHIQVPQKVFHRIHIHLANRQAFLFHLFQVRQCLRNLLLIRLLWCKQIPAASLPLVRAPFLPSHPLLP